MSHPKGVTETVVDLSGLQDLDPRLAMAIAFRDDTNPTPIQLLVQLHAIYYQDKPIQHPSDLPGKWEYLWMGYWVVRLENPLLAPKVCRDPRVKSAVLED